MLNGYQKKAVYRDRANIFEFCKIHGVGRGSTFFFTLTFRDNITDRKLAGRLWNIMNTAIKKTWKDFRYILVAERQQRGSWHFHVLGCIPELSSLNRLRKFLLSFVSESGKPFGFFRLVWTFGKSYKGVASYMVKYMTKQIREKGVRLVCYSRNWCRAVKLPFSWLCGPSDSWRSACKKLDYTFPHLFKFVYKNSKFDFKLDLIGKCIENDFSGCFRLFKSLDLGAFSFVRNQEIEVHTFNRTSNFLSFSSEFYSLFSDHLKRKADFFNLRFPSMEGVF